MRFYELKIDFDEEDQTLWLEQGNGFDEPNTIIISKEQVEMVCKAMLDSIKSEKSE